MSSVIDTVISLLQQSQTLDGEVVSLIDDLLIIQQKITTSPESVEVAYNAYDWTINSA